MKMYILIRDSVPDNMVPVISAHASLMCYLKYKDNPEMQKWLDSSFKKCVCSVSDKEYKNSIEVLDNIQVDESTIGLDICRVFLPRIEYPKMFNFFKLWKPKGEIRRKDFLKN